mgnify:CR=1 FL=1
MTTTAFDDQFATAPEPLHQLYDTDAQLKIQVQVPHRFRLLKW